MKHIAWVGGMLCVVAFGFCARSEASSISVNGSCVVGTCLSTDVLAVGATASTPFNFTYSFANSDRYQLTGVLSVVNSSGFALEVSNFVTTYLGNATGGTSGEDILETDFLQNIANRTAYSTTAYESVGGMFGPDLGSASSASGTFAIAGRQLPLLGPYFASTGPSFSGYATQTVRIPAGTPLLDYRYTLTFGSGSQAGSSIGINPVSVTPEPSSLVLLGTGMAGLLTTYRKRRTAQAS